MIPSYSQKCTEGNWQAHIGDDYFMIENEGGLCVVPECKFFHGEGQEHDVYMLAAAKDMFIALEDMCTLYREMMDTDYSKDPSISPEYRQALAVLAKARLPL